MVLGEIWRRAAAVQEAPSAAVVAATALLAAVLVAARATWPVTRMLVTVVHEGGHAVAALLVGRRLGGIRVHSDTSGLTISHGRPRGPGVVAMLLAGYLSPAAVGLSACLLLLKGRSLGLLWLFVLLLALLLLQIRNLVGFAVVLGTIAALAAVSWYVPPTAQSALAYLLTWLLLFAAPKPVLELARQRRRPGLRQSDADQLARLTRAPAGLFVALFLIANLAGLVLGAGLLLPALVDVAARVVGRVSSLAG